MQLLEEQGLSDGPIGRDPRQAIHLNVVVSRPGKRPKGCRAINVSVGGMFLELPVDTHSNVLHELTQAEFNPGDEIDILCSIKTAEGRVDLSLPSRVRHFRDNGIGVAFIQQQPEIIDLLKGYMESLRAGQPTESTVFSIQQQDSLNPDAPGIGVIDVGTSDTDEDTADLEAIPRNQIRYNRWRYTTYIVCGAAFLLFSTAVAFFSLTKQSVAEQELTIGQIVNSVKLVKQELADQQQLFTLSIDELFDARSDAKSITSIRTEMHDIQIKLDWLVKKIAEIEQSGLAMSGLDKQSANINQHSLDDKVKKVRHQSVIERSVDIDSNTNSPSIKAKDTSKQKPISQSTVTSSAAKGSWKIYLVALRNKTNAQRLVEKGAALGISIASQEFSGSKRPYWRLSVGGFPTIEAAKQAAPGIAKQLGLTETWISRN